ncbi:hypothetical protein [Actinokineospora cianjurensis]|uniref:Uncharacterized protein n=1 Tax=Actinokineospora cianjurensis TaxID=585224 RepID=A0A421B0Q9_9PSEU|nr:hypothetical protein [Actinokineospora cianjurensis]RLK55589.1 hypothetical protein CLV68_5078 [Actinokineospora cianjurensis]
MTTTETDWAKSTPTTATATGWLARAAEVSALLAVDASWCS